MKRNMEATEMARFFLSLQSRTLQKKNVQSIAPVLSHARVSAAVFFFLSLFSETYLGCLFALADDERVP